MYMPFAQQAETGFALVLRERPGRSDVAPDIRRLVASLDPDQPVYGIRTMDEVVSESAAQPRFRTTLILIFAGIAVVLAMTGIYGVVSYLVSRRAREIGIRLALGAAPADVVRLVVGDGMRGAVLGVAVGLGAAAAAARLLRTLLFGVVPTDVATFAAVAAILLGVGLLACALPARRAARTDPAVTLRSE
jgi:putative ABC transport system permease protein